MAVSFQAAGALVGTVTLPQLDIVAPACAENDILIAAINAKDNQVWTAPAGWTIFHESNNTTAQRVTLAWKRAVTADSGATFSFTVPIDNNITYHGMISAWRGCITTGSPIDATTPTASANASSDTVTYATFTPTQKWYGYVVAIGFYNNDLTTAGAISGTDPTLTNRWDLEDTTGTDASIFGYSGPATGAATGARSHSTTSMADDINVGVLFGLVLPVLEQGLVSHWTLDEASGTRADSVVASANDLTDNNTVTQAAGKLGNAAQFTLANSEYLSHVDNADLSMGAGVRMTLVAWVYSDSFTSGLESAHTIVGKRQDVGNHLEYQLRALNASSKFSFFVSNTGSTTVEVTDPTARSVSTWYLVIAWYDGTNINIQVDDGTVTSLAFSADIRDDISKFGIGAFSNDGTAWHEFWDGRIDLVSLYKRVLTATERAQHYNHGAGLAYPFTENLAPTGSKPNGLIGARFMHQIIGR